MELGSKGSLKNVSMVNGGGEGVLLEGSLGELVSARFEEDVILEVVGSEGTLRVDLCLDEIKVREDEGQ